MDFPRGRQTWLWDPGLNTYHSSPVHRETAIRLHDNGAEFHVLGVSAAALWSEPAHWSSRGGGRAQRPSAGSQDGHRGSEEGREQKARGLKK